MTPWIRPREVLRRWLGIANRPSNECHLRVETQLFEGTADVVVFGPGLQGGLLRDDHSYQHRFLAAAVHPAPPFPLLHQSFTSEQH